MTGPRRPAAGAADHDLQRLGHLAAGAIAPDTSPLPYAVLSARIERAHRKRKVVRTLGLMLAVPAVALAAASVYPLVRRARDRIHEGPIANPRVPALAPPPVFDDGARTQGQFEAEAQAGTGVCAEDDSGDLPPPFLAVQTFPARRLREAVGMCVRPDSPVERFDRLLDHLARAGVRRINFDIAWDAMSAETPTELGEDKRRTCQGYARAIVERGLRPVVKLFGNPGHPVPERIVTIHVTEKAAAGAHAIRIDPASGRALVSGRSGLPQGGSSIGVLFTSITPDGHVTLARPLPRALPAGATPATVFAFAPFEAPLLPDQTANPTFEGSLRGWLAYAGSVCRAMAEATGGAGYDLELLDQQAEFFDRTRYDEGQAPSAVGDEIRRAIVARTARWLRRPDAGCGSFRLLDNLSHREGSVASANAPGVDLVARHVVVHAHEVLELLGDARGQVPQVNRNRAVFPEVPLLDVADTAGLGLPAGDANAALPTPPLAVTSFNLNPRKMTPLFEAMPAAEVWRFRSKAVLRALSAYVGQGIVALDLYRAYEPDVSVVDPTSTADGGAALRTLRRYLDRLQGEVPAGAERNVRIAGISNCDTRANLPAERIAITPLQTGANAFALSVYVMSQDLLHPYGETDAGDGRRHDRPEQRYALWLDGVRGRDAQVELYDPLDEDTTEISGLSVLAREDNRIRVTVPLTDSPRLLLLRDAAP